MSSLFWRVPPFLLRDTPFERLGVNPGMSTKKNRVTPRQQSIAPPQTESTGLAPNPVKLHWELMRERKTPIGRYGLVLAPEDSAGLEGTDKEVDQSSKPAGKVKLRSLPIHNPTPYSTGPNNYHMSARRAARLQRRFFLLCISNPYFSRRCMVVMGPSVVMKPLS